MKKEKYPKEKKYPKEAQKKILQMEDPELALFYYLNFCIIRVTRLPKMFSARPVLRLKAP